MRPFSFVLLALACLGSTPAAAQTGAQPNLVLTILAGSVTGHQLWVVGRQPLQVLNTGNYDTLRMSRAIGSSIVLGAAATYFIRPHVGVHAELSYLGLPIDNSCTGLFYHPDAENKNQQICDNIQAQPADGGAVTVFGGVTLRAAPRGAFSPYVRGSVGIVNQTRSTIDVAGVFVDGTGPHVRQVILDREPRRTSVLFGGAVGFTSPLGPGYQFRLEVRDVLTALERLTGPANALGDGPTDSRFYHHVALILGFDVVLERSRGRRY